VLLLFKLQALTVCAKCTRLCFAYCSIDLCGCRCDRSAFLLGRHLLHCYSPLLPVLSFAASACQHPCDAAGDAL
jgi:hypothetical protein